MWLLIGVAIGFILAIAAVVLFSIGKQVVNRAGDAIEIVQEEQKKELPEGVTLFDEPGEIIDDVNSFEILQVIYTDFALAFGNNFAGTLYALYNDENKYYYDREEIEVPKDKVVKQIGIYRYPSKNDIIKTVPIVMITDK